MVKKEKHFKKVNVFGTSTAIVEKAKKDLEPYLFFSWYSNFTRSRAAKVNIPGDGLSDCESDSTKDVEKEEEKDEEIPLGDFMEESETTENKRAIPKTLTSVTKDKQKNNCKKCLPFKGKPKTDTDLEAMKEMVVSIKKRRESFKSPDVKNLYCQSFAASRRGFTPPDLCMINHEIKIKRFVQPQPIIISPQP